MPFVPSRFDPGRISEIPELPEQDQEGPKFFTEVVPAAFRLENMLGSAMAEEQAPRYERNILGQRVGVIYEGFNPFTEGDMTGYEDFADRFVGVHTETQFDAMKRQIDRELVDRRTIEESGVGGFVASLGASIVDPTVFLPVGGALSKGASVLQISRRAALAGGASTFVQEVGLQATQETRTLGESAINIGGATFLGGVLGGAVGLIGRRQLVNAGRQVETEMRVPGQGEPDPIAPDEVLRAPEMTAEQAQRARARREREASFNEQDAEAEVARLQAEIDEIQAQLNSESIFDRGDESAEDFAYRHKDLRDRVVALYDQQSEILNRDTPYDFELDADGNLIDLDARAPEPDLPGLPKAPGEARGVGAQAVAKGTSDQLQIDTAVARVLGRIASNPLKFIDPIAPAGVRKAAEIISSEPVTRTMLSPSVEARRLASGLTEIPSTLKGERATVNADGSVTFGQARRQSVETMIKLADAQLGRAFRMTDDIYVKYLRGRERRPGDIMVAGIEGIGGRRDGKLNKPQFEKEIARAMRRGDTSEIPEVQEAAERLRKEFFQPLEDQAVELRLFGEERVPNPDDPEGEDIWVPRRPSVEGTAESFMLRLYDREKIKRNRPAFTQIIYNHFVRKRADAVREAEQLEDAIVGAQEVVKTFWDATRNALSERNALARKARELRGRTDRQDANLKGREREAGVASRDAERRRQEIDNQSMTPADEAYFKGLLREVRRGHGDDKPRRLSQWVIDNGGILDPETQMPQSVLRRPGLVNRNVDDGSGRTRRGGVPLDNLREMAIEDGYYLPDGADAMNGGNLSDFVDMLVRDLNGDEVYAMNRPDVADAVHHMEYLRGVRDEMAEDGLDYTSVSAAEFGSWLAGAKLKQRTRFKKGQMKEALIREERAGQRLRKVQDDLEDFEVDQADSRAAARTMRELMPEKTEEANMARKQHRQARRELNAMRRELFKTQARAERTDEDLLADATRTVDNILANPAGRINNEGAGVHKVFRANTQLEYMSALSGRFKARALDIPDVEIEEFLDSELPTLMRALQRSMVPDMELIKRYGSIDLELELNQVAEDFQAQIFKVDQDPKYKTEKQRQARRATLENEMNDTMRDLMGVRDRLRGVYGMPTDPESLSERVASNLIHLNYLRLMGGVTISSLPDLPRAVMTYGVGKTAGTAFRALTGNFNTIKMLDDELKAAGTGFEMVLNTRIMEMTDLINDRGAKSALERFTHSATSQFGYASLIAPWNRAMKAIAGYGVQNRLLQAAMNTADGKATAADADLLVRLGFSEDNSRQLAAMFRQHGQTENGNLIARSDQWGNEDLRQMWLGALRKEVDDLVVTPGQNKPLLASTTWGRVLLNLRSYNMAATQKVMMRYAQGVITGREAHVYMMLMTQIGLGAAVAKIKADQYGLNTDNWNERKWMVEAMDRSGLLGAFTDINMMAEYATGGRVGLSAIAGQGRMSRYASRNMLGQFLGPSAGLASDATTALALGGDIAAKAFGDEEAEIYRSDIRAARRLLPYQNMWFLRDLFDRMEDDLGDALGATGESLAERRERMATEDA